MRFSLIDRITELAEGEHIVAIKVLTLSEEYLHDHFPRFPVMPGVMILEAMYQASAWLIRKSEDFAHTMVVLREVRNAKFSAFVKPGRGLVIRATVTKQTETTTTLKAEATVEGEMIVTARLVLDRYTLEDRYPKRAATDDYMRRELRKQFDVLYDPSDAASAV
ncbi:MAG: 3-hydroxyacyl-ACP dehydratase FabZ family protein [Planctomycetota bacterium]